VAHEADEAAHPFFVDQVAGQAQVVAQPAYALEVMARKLLIEQAHERQIQRSLRFRLVVKAAAG
jgi:hypothetical protein